MTDPLSLLREFNIKKKKVYVDGTHLVFGNLTCPRSTETNFKQQSRSKYYTIESIWFFLKNIDVPHLKYVLLASNEKINPVSLPDRNLLAQYLRGQISTCKSIDPNKFPGVLTKVYKRQSKDLTEISEPQAPSQKLLKEKFSLIEQSEDQSVSTVKPLSEKLTAEKILELKAHRQARKQLTGGKTDAEDLTIGSSFIQTDASISQRIISLERSFHTRDSVMMAQSLRFDKDLLPFRKNQLKAEPAPLAETWSLSGGRRVKKMYDRYDVSEDRHFQDKGIGVEDFQIDTRGSHMAPLSILSPHKEDTAVQEFAGNKSDSVKKSKTGSRENTIPIIIVPSAPTSLLTIFNVKDFLESGIFTPSSEARAAMGQKPPMVVVYRKMHGGRTVPFHVYDQTHKFTQEQWDRVCAIFIVGMAWQFKGFPFNSDAVKNLNKFRGYFLAFNDPLFTIPENIHKWDVCVLKVNKRDRDIDATAYTEFWEDLDKFWSHRTGKPIMN